VQWARSYGGGSADFLSDIQVLPSGGFVVAGNSKSWVQGTRPTDAWLLRLNDTGGTRWSHTYGDTLFDAVYSVRRAADGGFAIAGYTGSGPNYSNSVLVVKTDSAGTRRWSFNYGSNDAEEFAYRIRQTLDGSYAVCGYGAHGVYDFMLLKVNAIGAQTWLHYFGTPNGIERAYDFDLTADRGYVMAGSGNGDPPESIFHPYVLRADSSGNEIWHQMLPDTGVLYSVRELADRSILVAGSKQTRGVGLNDFFLARLNADGGLMWSRTYPGADNSYAWAVRPTPDGGYILAGHTIQGSDHDIFVVKTAPDNAEAVTATPRAIPAGYELAVYPNPFNPVTTLAFDLPVAAAVRLVIYDVTGREVKRVEEGFFAAGSHAAHLDASAWSSGVYFARMQAGAVRKTAKLLLIK
jgi:hypothetical protein